MEVGGGLGDGLAGRNTLFPTVRIEVEPPLGVRIFSAALDPFGSTVRLADHGLHYATVRFECSFAFCSSKNIFNIQINVLHQKIFRNLEHILQQNRNTYFVLTLCVLCIILQRVND